MRSPFSSPSPCPSFFHPHLVQVAAAVLEVADLFRNFHDDGRNRRNARCGLQFRTMHINKSKRGDGLETETSFTTVNFPRMRSFFITGIPYSHSMVAGGLEEMS